MENSRNIVIEELKNNGDEWYYVNARLGGYILESAKSKKGFEQARKNLKKKMQKY